ncbi:MOSC domain containing protein [Croceitalea dokdonensis DOKDO 023]|uniref:MOSC domain containing protein n=1 Tax=Croceitalea dokdonensis DOKDO 023 TaxID=1300341 RepID=A0A0P7ATJ3_9FLAO|nr:MOSC domain-containing protein [Croceitalea dokdonensis]KPM31761.1 MOSC domain containing protein [Croceitalea dokdonensis DOKDO 023]
MEVIAVNIGEKTKTEWKGKTIETGIYKFPISGAIHLEKEDVKGDSVVDRKYHGGEFQAAYLFSADNYSHYKEKYPHLEWDWGMFGENITIKGLKESHLLVGSTYSLGKALVQITLPREPCYKLGIRFKDQSVLKDFIAHNCPGTYVKVLEPGEVKAGDSMVLVNEAINSVSIADFYRLLYAKEKDQKVLRCLIDHPNVPESKRKKLQKLS